MFRRGEEEGQGGSGADGDEERMSVPAGVAGSWTHVGTLDWRDRPHVEMRRQPAL